MKVRIQSNGYAYSTKITNAETGEDLGGLLKLKSVEIIAGDKDPFQINMTAYCPQIDITSNAVVFCPHCHRQMHEKTT